MAHDRLRDGHVVDDVVVRVGEVAGGRHEEEDVRRGRTARGQHEERDVVLRVVQGEAQRVDVARQIGGHLERRCPCPSGSRRGRRRGSGSRRTAPARGDSTPRCSPSSSPSCRAPAGSRSVPRGRCRRRRRRGRSGRRAGRCRRRSPSARAGRARARRRRSRARRARSPRARACTAWERRSCRCSAPRRACGRRLRPQRSRTRR